MICNQPLCKVVPLAVGGSLVIIVATVATSVFTGISVADDVTVGCGIVVPDDVGACGSDIDEGVR